MSYLAEDGESLTYHHLCLSFPKVSPSGPDQLVTGAASAVPQGPGHRAAVPPTTTHTPHRRCQPEEHRWRVAGTTLSADG